MAAGVHLEADGVMPADMAVLKAITTPLPRRSTAQKRSTRAVVSGKFQFHMAAPVTELGRNLICAVCALMRLYSGERGVSPL